MVQHTEWRSSDGNKILPAFQQAAVKAFGVRPTRAAAAPAARVGGQPAAILPNLNRLTDGEKAGGGKFLFDGRSTAGWRNFKAADGLRRLAGDRRCPAPRR